MTETFQIKKTSRDDIPLIFSFIKELAEYEKLSREVTATPERLSEMLFGKKPYAEVVIGYISTVPVSIAIYFHNFSTFLGRPGLYLEDLFVKPEFRGQGIGKKMFVYLAQIAKERNCARLEWSVLNWNELAIGFYKRMGANPMKGSTVYRITGKALEDLAEL